jgi:hypothetical protein
MVSALEINCLSWGYLAVSLAIVVHKAGWAKEQTIRVSLRGIHDTKVAFFKGFFFFLGDLSNYSLAELELIANVVFLAREKTRFNFVGTFVSECPSQLKASSAVVNRQIAVKMTTVNMSNLLNATRFFGSLTSISLESERKAWLRMITCLLVKPKSNSCSRACRGKKRLYR